MNEEGVQRLEKLIKIQTKEVKEEIQKEVGGLRSEISKINEKLRVEANEREKIKKKQTELEDTFEEFQRVQKKNNIIIFGLELKNDVDVATQVIDTLNSQLNVNLTSSVINNIYPLGKGERRPILLQFLTYFTKLEILKECSKLKHTKISISDDLTPKERKIRKILVKHKKIAQQNGHKVSIKGKFLYINGDKYLAEDLEVPENEESEILDIPTKSNSAPPTPVVARESEQEEPVFLEEIENERKTHMDVPMEKIKTVQNILFTRSTRNQSKVHHHSPQDSKQTHNIGKGRKEQKKSFNEK